MPGLFLFMNNKLEFVKYFIITLFLLATYYSFEIRELKSFYFKKNDEIHARLINLRFNHLNFHRAKNNPDSISFIKQLDYSKSRKSFSNADGRSSVLYFHSYWGLEKGIDIYGIENPNIFRINYDAEKFLLENNIKSFEKNCHEVRKNSINKINKSQFNNKLLINKNFLLNEISFQKGNKINSLIYIEAELETINQYLSLLIKDTNENIIGRSEIDLANLRNPINYTYASKIFNTNTNLIILDTGSKYGTINSSGNFSGSAKIWALLFIDNYIDFIFELNSYDDLEKFKLISDLNSKDALKIKLNNKDPLSVISLNHRLIGCEGSKL